MVRKKIVISIIVPVYNENRNIQQFHSLLMQTMAKCQAPYEIIYVDDNSTDGTYEWLRQNAPDVSILRKSGLRGKAYSLLQGFKQAKGDVFVMIDGDLQYPPHKIPEMIQALKDADIVVANRTDYNDGHLRKFLSKSFRYLFGKLLFGLNTDIQSGFKVFTRKVYETVDPQPQSPWTFDMAFLARARQAGFTLTNVPITFAKRMNDKSKVHVLAQSWEIGLNALYIKLQRTDYLPIRPQNSTMRGAGIGHKRKKYITHTTLSPRLSAIKTFSIGQKFFLIGMPVALLISLLVSPLPALRIVVAVLSVLYFVDALFHLFVVLKSIKSEREITISAEELAQLNESMLPVYTILCPLYKEAHVAPQFLEAIAKLDWPKEKLDVMFLLEEDDKETIKAFNTMHLPYYARTVIVPDSAPKTKPKACNYGLSFAKGKYLVIYDAEDVPDPLQLKKAYLGFQKVPGNVKCLQAKLSYYNAGQNLLTRFFTAEYALWFDITLPGLQSLHSALPLGGTSNHFETANLYELQGWDPFNVTEDADLGVRLFQKGYQTAIIESTTYEEATSVVKNWLRQRSRWLKGYMQTYLVHTRNAGQFIRSKGLWHYFIFQLTVGGKILFVLLNPTMWVITILYFGAYSIFGPTMQEIYRPPYSYLAVVSWIFGNFIFLYCYMIAVAKRKQWDITKYVLLIPVYWLMMSTAAAVAFYQLLFKPHYWEKTIHGFHLGIKKQPIPTPSVAKRPAVQPAFAPVTRPGMRMPNFSVSFAFPSLNLKAFVIRWLPLFAILNTDLVLARYFLAPQDAQTYIILSFFGKGIFLLSIFASNVMTAFVTRNKTSKAYLYRLIFMTFLFVWLGFSAFGLEGQYTIPPFFNGALTAVIPYTSFYLFGLLCYSIAYRLTVFNFYKKTALYSLVTFASVALQGPFVSLGNATVADSVRIFAYSGSVNLLILIIFEMSISYKKIAENNIESFLSLFDRQKTQPSWSVDVRRILVFNWRDTKHKYTGGAEVYIQELAKRWVQNGNKVTLFCGNDNKHAGYEMIDGVEIYRRGGTYTVYLFAFIYYMLKFRGKYDVIIDCENGIPFFTPLYAKEQVILLIHHVHQEIFRNFLQFPLNFVAELLEGKFMPIVYRDKHIVTVSASSQKDILRLGFTNEKNIHIVPNGVSDSLFVDYAKTDYPSFIYLGRLKAYKNIDTAIKAFAKIVQVSKKATLAIVGEGESISQLRRLVAELKITDSVTFYGRVSDEEKARLLAKSWAALQPSQMEGWGLTVIEANAAGTPVIASKVSGLQDSVISGLTGILVPPKNIIQLANEMMNIIENDTLRMSLTQEARLWARNFDWDKSADTFSSLIGKYAGQGITRPSYPDVILSAMAKE